MSADNFLYVCQHGSRWAIVDRSASVDMEGQYPPEMDSYERPIVELDDAFDALNEAGRLDYTGVHWTEYGVQISPAAQRALHGESI